MIAKPCRPPRRGLRWVGWLVLMLPLWVRAQAVPFDEGLLFRLEPPGGGPSSYLFGTIHSEDARVLALPESVREAFDAMPAFAMEVVPDDDALERSMAAMRWQDDTRLADVLPPDLYRETVTALARLGLPESFAATLKPWAATTLIGTPKAQTGKFLDLVLYRDALDARKTVAGLETLEEQLAVFEDLSLADQVELLRETLESLSELPGLFEEMTRGYLRRDLGALLDLNDYYLGDAAPELARRFQHALIDARNMRMSERVLPMIRQGGHFIAVGALHLPGADGLLALLSAQGVGIVRVY